MSSLHISRTNILERLERAGLHPFSAPITVTASEEPITARRYAVRGQQGKPSVKAKPAPLKRRGVA
jgi:hypothetical protein